MTSRPTELRYRIADFINDRLKALPGVHAAAKAAVSSWLGGGRGVHQEDNAKRIQPLIRQEPEIQPLTRHEPEPGAISLDNLPLPALEMRELVGPTDPAAFDNPTGRLVYEYLDPALYEKVFDFGCGCGRVARQLMLQRPSPAMYVGVDLHAGMIRWCQRNLQPAAPNFSFLHHDVFDARFNPKPGSPTVARFPVSDGQFTLVNALSVFTHLTEEQAVFYLQECARILAPNGVLHASWFLFDKREFPMMGASANSLYVSYVHPGAAVLFDREWVRTTARQFGLRIGDVVRPNMRGHQWGIIMTKRQDVQEREFPPDTAPYGNGAPPSGAAFDVSRIGLETDES